MYLCLTLELLLVRLLGLESNYSKFFIFFSKLQQWNKLSSLKSIRFLRK